MFHADDDADVIIVKKDVIEDDTDLLVLLLCHVRNIKSFDIFFHPEHKQFARKKPITVSIHSAVRKLGMELCENILFIHALLGCAQFLVYLNSKKSFIKSIYSKQIFSRTGTRVRKIWCHYRNNS